LAHDNGWSFDDDQGNSRAAQHGGSEAAEQPDPQTS
jgi:hypothetical protein